MGTSSAYIRAVGEPGKEIREGIEEWYDSLYRRQSEDGIEELDDIKTTPVPFLSKVARGFFQFFQEDNFSDVATGGISRHRGSNKIRAGWGRSVRRLSSVSGRTAMGAYAYIQGDIEALRSLGLEYEKLRALDDPVEVTRQIVDVACGREVSGTLEVAEERYVAASLAEWVLNQNENREQPDMDDIARKAISIIIYEVLSSELSATVRDKTEEFYESLDRELCSCCDILAEQSELSVSDPTQKEFIMAIQLGIKKLQNIYVDEL